MNDRVSVTLREPQDGGVRRVEFHPMGDGTVAISILDEVPNEDVGHEETTILSMAIVSAEDLGAVARALPALGIVPAE